MAGCLIGAKPIWTNAGLYCEFDPWEQISVKF